MTLTAFLREALDCYLRDSDTAWMHLNYAQQEIRLTKSREEVSEEANALKRSQKRTKRAFKARLLMPVESQTGGAETVIPKKGLQETDRSREAGENRRTKAAAEQYRAIQERRLQYVLDVLAWNLNRERKEDPASASDESGEFSKDEILEVFTKDGVLARVAASGWQEVEREYTLSKLGEPNIEAHLARNLLDSLEAFAAKIDQDGPISFRDSIPGHLKQYLYEAQWCNLNGFDAACTALCGSILQEAIRISLGKESFNGLDEAITAAEGGLLTPKAVDAAREVMRMRNLAAHGNQRFAKSPEDRRKSSLPITREILDTLFAKEI